jgi:hypothetical protein
MSATNATVSRIKGTSSLVKPRFEPGMLLQHDDLDQMMSYTSELSRLMFRSLFGCGVVCGLVVKTGRDECGRASAVIHAGLAFDGCGDPIHVPQDVRLSIDERCDPALAPPLWVLLCRYSKNCSPRTAMCASDEADTTSVCTREREGYEIRIVRQLPKCICDCEPPGPAEKYVPFKSECCCVDPTLPCYADHYAGKCGCSCDDCTSGSCDCDCVVLARLDRARGEDAPWTVDHRYRRFVRPVLMRDPQVEVDENERKAKKDGTTDSENTAASLRSKGKPMKVKTATTPSV